MASNSEVIVPSSCATIVQTSQIAEVQQKKEAACVTRLKKIAFGKPNDYEQDVEKCFREEALEEKCGVFGCISNGDWPTSLDVAHIICLGLVGLQHRGQESAGIVTCKFKSESFKVCRSEGLVSQAFSEMSMMSLKGNIGVGHTRYSTTGGSDSIQLAQPFVVHTSYGTIAVAHNGELANSGKLRKTLFSHGVGLTTGGDSELITQCLSQPPPEEFKHPRFRTRRPSMVGSRSTSSGGGEHNGCSYLATTATNDGNAESPVSTNAAGADADGAGRHAASPELASSSSNRVPIWKVDLNADENNITSRLLHLMSLTPVSYSLIVMYNECLYATRDSFGNRPLAIGMLMPPPNAGDMGSIPFSIIDNCFIEGWVLSSESCPFPSVHAKLKRDVKPGEIIKFERNRLPKTLAYMPRPGFAESPAFCIFEYVYFARPDSIMETQAVYSVRKKCGQRLARESAPFPENCPASVKRDYIVAPVPESAIPAALGFAQEVGLPYVEVFCKNRYVGRTFIQPSTRLRRLGVAKKFGPLIENFVGKNIILIDDSIVRGTTIGQLVRLLREAGAKKVHIRIASPPLHHPCNMGINIPTKEELIANHLSPDQLALSLGAASLKYLSVKGLRESVQSGIKENIIADKSKLQMPQVGDLAFDSIVSKSFSSNDLTMTRMLADVYDEDEDNDEVGRKLAEASSLAALIESNDECNAWQEQQQQEDCTLIPDHHNGRQNTCKHQQSNNSNNKNNNNTNTNTNTNTNGYSKDQQTKATVKKRHNIGELNAEDSAKLEAELRRKVGHCDACLTGKYPVNLEEESF